MANPSSFKRFLGKGQYYHEFLVFFKQEMEKKGWENVVNEYVFAGDERAEDMLTRLFAGEKSIPALATLLISQDREANSMIQDISIL